MNWVRLAENGCIPTDVKYINTRISFDRLNWWMRVWIEYPECREPLSEEKIGIDLGIKDLAICSDANKYKNINKSKQLGNCRNVNADYNVAFPENMNKIRKEEVTVKQRI